MSIIYDALKKTEQAIDPKAKTAPEIKTTKAKENKPQIEQYILYALVVVIGLVAANTIFSFFPRSNKPSLSQVKSLQQETPKPEPLLVTLTEPVTTPGADVKKQTQVSLLLNGVFFSEEEGFALINNRVVKEGDEIEGLIVTRVNLDSVELAAKDGTIIKLSTSQRQP